MSTFYAHSVRGQRSPTDQWQLLRAHLAAVADLAHRRAQQTGVPGLADAAWAAGWLHDLGKYRESFQDYICGRDLRGRSKAHKEAGAARAAKVGSLPLAFAILGHHHGMPDPTGTEGAQGAVAGPDGLCVANEVQTTAERECPELTSLPIAKRSNPSAESDLFTRLLLSCLVDADWTDTSEHERTVRGWPEYPKSPGLEADTRLQRLQTFIAERAAATREKNPNLAALRQQILEVCLTKAEGPTNLFTLTVPTGGGKTLSGLAFALKHAVTRNLRRVIYVAPFISILDQNANVIRDALGIQPGDGAVLEHQSLAEPDPFGPEKDGAKLSIEQEKQKASAARLAENWDAPVVVTTNVQFFESLFSNKPGRCRKLHNIARSVIVLDECQSLPPDLVKPTCQMLKQLVASLGCTVILCTATQPAFDHETLNEHRLTAQEIIPDELKLFHHLKRVTLRWPADRDERLDWPEVAKRMTTHTSALCVVNTKAAAQNLFEELKKLSQNAFHLSTNMCPAHRLAVLDAIKRRLDKKQAVYVVSTQLIEAGVDIDFPCVFREMAPLEAIIQAAGRCNREGLIPHAGGQVFVFRCLDGETKIPPGWYKKGRNVVETVFLAAKREPQIDSPADIQEYFSHLYWTGNLDAKNVAGLRAGFKFESCADAYRLIRDDTVPVVVATWEEHRDEIETLLAALRERPIRENFRALAPFQVNVFRSELKRLPAGMAVTLCEDVDLLVWRGRYDREGGRVSEFQELIDSV